MKMLLGAVALVTLVACANVANLLLVRGTRRRAEIAIRSALGAGSRRIARQLLTESAVLAAAGAAAGLALAAASLDGIVALAPGERSAAVGGAPRRRSPRLHGRLDDRLRGALRTGARAGGAAAGDDARRCADSARTRAAPRGACPRARSSSSAQVALALVLAAGAGLLLRSLARLSSVDPGFRTERALSFSLTLPKARYPDEAARGAFLDRLLESMRTLPGVRSAGAVFGFPLTGMSFSSSFRASGAAPDDNEPSAQLRVASRGLLRDDGNPGRRRPRIHAEDRRGAPIAILVSESAARKFFPAGDAIGRRLRFGATMTETRIEGEVVGVVGDVRDAELGAGPTPEFYGSLEQAPTDEFHVVVRGDVPPDRLAGAVRAAIAGLDPELAVTRLRDAGRGRAALGRRGRASWSSCCSCSRRWRCCSARSASTA